MRSPPPHSPPRAPAPRLGSEDDSWLGENVIRLEEDLVRRWLMPAALPDNAPVVSCLRVVFVCALFGAMVWALAGYGLVRLVAG